MPSMLTSVASVVCQVSVGACPFSTVLGLAVSDAVGAAGGGGGGGGGGGVFLWQAPKNRIAPNANTRVIHFILCCFTFPPCVVARCCPQRASESIAGRVHFSASSGLVNRKNFAKLMQAQAPPPVLSQSQLIEFPQPYQTFRVLFKRIRFCPLLEALLPTPIRLRIFTAKSQLLHVAAVRQHGPD